MMSSTAKSVASSALGWFRELRASRSLLMVLVLLLMVSACGDQLVAPPSDVALERILTPDAARSLTRNGQFILPQGGEEGAAAISAERAKTLALAYWQAHVEFLRPFAERDRGSPIATRGLQPCQRAYYAAGAYELFGEEIPVGFRRHYGPQWLVGLCLGEEQQVAIAVSSQATNVEYERVGERVQMRGARAGDFFFLGVPSGAEIPIRPEIAAAMVAQVAGRRISNVPNLRRRSAPYSALNSVWHVELEDSLAVRGAKSRSLSHTREVVVGHFEGWMHPRLALPILSEGIASSHDAVPLRHNSSGLEVLIQLSRRDGFVSHLEPFVVEDR